jgi:RimJ/RimL family protein N-acetyltransferase
MSTTSENNNPQAVPIVEPAAKLDDTGVVLETERLRLRKLVEEDAVFILRLLNEPSWLRFIGDRGVHSLETARHYIRNGPQQMYREHGFGLFVVESRATRLPMGLCGLLRRATLPDADIGFAFLPEFWGQGYAFEAADATLRHGRDVHGLDRIVAITVPENASSRRLLEKLGLRCEGTVRLQGSSEDLLYFGTTADFGSPATAT